MRAARPALALALAGMAASGSIALAADAPKSTPTSQTLFMAQEGCGTTAEAGRLETKPQDDGATGCGTIGGLPVNEIIVQGDGDASGIAEDYTSTKKLVPFMVDGSKKVTGQVAAGSWVGNGAGGLGAVAWDVHMTGTTVAGKLVDFGTTSVTASAAPGTDVVTAPFTLTVPASAAGQTFKTFVVSVAQHGANLGMSAKQLSGDQYVVIPVKPKPVKRRR